MESNRTTLHIIGDNTGISYEVSINNNARVRVHNIINFIEALLRFESPHYSSNSSYIQLHVIKNNEVRYLPGSEIFLELDQVHGLQHPIEIKYNVISRSIELEPEPELDGGGYKRRKYRYKSRKKVSHKKISRKKISRKKHSRKKHSRKKSSHSRK